MKTPTKFVKPLTPEQREQLSALMKSAAPQRTRMRAHVVLLSERRYSLEQIADIYQVDRDRVSQGLEWWEAKQVAGLDDEPRSGRPLKLPESERQEALTIALQDPRTIKTGLKRIADELGKHISGETLRALLTTERSVWKRMRRSARTWRDETEFRAAAAELAWMRAPVWGGRSAVDLKYYDEAGFPSPVLSAPAADAQSAKLQRLWHFRSIRAAEKIAGKLIALGLLAKDRTGRLLPTRYFHAVLKDHRL